MGQVTGAVPGIGWRTSVRSFTPFTARADESFELAEGVLCAGGPVRTLAGLSLVPSTAAVTVLCMTR